MVNSMYSFCDVESKAASPSTLKDAVLGVLRANDGECYSSLEVYLMPPGVSGSRSFDQAYAVSTLLEFDRSGDGMIARILANTPNIKHRSLWDVLQVVLRGSGFKMKHGRLVGLLEHNPDSKDDTAKEDGQPDID